MSIPDPLAPCQMPTPETLSRHLVQHLSAIRGYTAALGELINKLCVRIGRDDATAPLELWRLLQGLHYGGAFSAANLDRFELQLSVLRPQWRSQ